MSTEQLLIILAVLVLIGIAVGIAAIIVMMRRPSRTTVIYQDAATAAAEPEMGASSPEPPRPDPLSKYLDYFQGAADCRAIEQVSEQEYLVLMNVWCTAATLELALACNNSDDGENYQPTFHLYFNYYDDGAWQIGDHGANAAALQEIGVNIPAELNDIRPNIRNLNASLGQDGTIYAQGTAYRGFETAIADLCKIADAMDDHYSPLIWDVAGPLPDARNAEGQRHQSTGRGVGAKSDLVENTHSFTLTAGAMIMTFECNGEAEIRLVRDKGGWFDEPSSFTTDAGRTIGLSRVAEGWYRDPHPDISYHLEVKARTAWDMEVFQPDLGQSHRQFPYRAGIDGGAQVFGPFRTGPQPVLANIQHDGNDEFTLKFVSLDGAHETDYEFDGQTHQTDKSLDLLPGKEYLLMGSGNGPWKIELTEGY